MKGWWRYRGTTRPNTDWRLPPAPSWRAFSSPQPDGADGLPLADQARGATFQADEQEIDMVNAALLLRRPLLVTGGPGTGKSSLAFAVAHELGLGPVLHWPINSRSTLREGLYDYDAIGRLQETSVRQVWLPPGADRPAEPVPPPDIGLFVTLRALGTALLPSDRPRVLLIDELDKADIDLPNDLLNVFEEGRFTIPELARLSERTPEVEIRTADARGSATVTRGEVSCREFPFVVLTSNGERDFPPAFLRRCLQLTLLPPDRDKLARIVEAHLGRAARDEAEALITEFISRRERTVLATDQLLNSVYLLAGATGKAPAAKEELIDTLLRSLGEVTAG